MICGSASMPRRRRSSSPRRGDSYRNVRVDPSVFVGRDGLTDYGRAHIVGIQGTLWSETLGGEGRLEYMMLPKLFGLAERGWAPDPDWARERDPAKSESLYREAWSRFVNVLGQRELPRLDREVAGVNYRIPTPGLRAQGGVVSSSLELPGFILRYTTDGSEPTVRSAPVHGPIPFRGTVRVAAFNTTGRKGHTAHLTAEPASPPPRGASGRSRDRRGWDERTLRRRANRSHVRANAT